MGDKRVAVGIDLGTCYSCVGIARDDGRVDVIANNIGNRITPSCVSFCEDDYFCGDPAKEYMVTNPQNTIYEIKRMIGRKFQDQNIQNDIKFWPFKVINDTNTPKVEVMFKCEKAIYTAEEISAIILTDMKKIAEEYSGCAVTDAVITVPAYFNDSQRQATKDAGKIAGLNVLHLLNEPTAAAIAYGIDKNVTDKINLLVYDLGGGTFDVAILSIISGEFVVKAVGGDSHLGGTDFDRRLVEHFIEFIRRTKKKDLSSDKKAISKLNKACESAKKRLSAYKRDSIFIDCLYDSKEFTAAISRAKFEDLCNDLFKSTFIHIDGILQDANLNKSDIKEVLLIGGSTRIPKIQEMIQEYFNGVKLNKSMQPDEAVAYGAAIKAAGSTKMYTMKEVKLSDVTPHSLGIQSGEGKMIISIERNSPIPTSTISSWTTFHDDQKEMEFCLYSGENHFAGQNSLLGSFCLGGIQQAKKGVPRINVTFQINENGIVTVAAIDTRTGCRNQLVIKSNKGRLSDTDIHRMMKEVGELDIDN